MKQIQRFLLACSAFLCCAVQVNADSETTWVRGEALLTKGSQLSANSSQSGFPPSNLLAPESEGWGTGQTIWHTAWSNPAPLPANTDPYLQAHLLAPETDIIFTMIGSTWASTGDTPTDVIVQAANLPDGKWTEIVHLTDMQKDFTSMQPERYASPHIALGEPYTDLRFVVKKTINAGNASRYDANGNPFVSLGRFQIYRAVQGQPEPVDSMANINLVFIGNSITAGATLGDASTQAPPVVAGKLIQQATEVNTNVFNGGHSGITTFGYLPGRDDFTRVCNAANVFRNNGGPIYFSIMLGTNDSACSTTEGAPVSPATYRQNMKKIIDELIRQFPTCKILVNYPIWYSSNTHNGARYLQEGQDRLHSYYPILDALVAEYDQVFAGNRGVWEYFADCTPLFTAENGNSGIFYLHPNARGAAHLANIWARSLLQLIQADGFQVKNPLQDNPEITRLKSGAFLDLFPAPADKANGHAVVIIPGGGYAYVAGNYEGADWAPLFNELGYSAAVLTYTTPPAAPDQPLSQGCDAMQYLRDHATELRLQPDHIGVLGFSAGGHLASTIATHTVADQRPAFQILFYPVISMESNLTHAGSRQNLLGDQPSQELIDLYSNEKQVSSETPRAYLCWATNDATVPPANSTRYASALRKAGVSVRTKSFATGGHGFGFNTAYENHNAIVKDLTRWLAEVDGFLTDIPQQPQTQNSRQQPRAVYNLTGQRIENPRHGLYIVSDARGSHKVIK